jgi:hypothetical protein
MFRKTLIAIIFRTLTNNSVAQDRTTSASLGGTSLILRLVVCLIAFSAADAKPQGKPADSAASYVKRGNSWFAKGDLDRAIADYDIAIAFEPDDGTVYYNRGRPASERRS